MSCDCNTLVIGEAGVQGPQGLAGINGNNGTNGINAFTTVGATFTQPAVNASITFSVVENRWIAVGQTIYISNAGFYTVTVVGGSPFTSVTATLVRAAGVNPAGSVVAGLKVSPSAGATYSDPLSSLTVTGSSILDGPTVVNESGAAVDFRVESDTREYLLYTKGSTNRIGVNTSSPAADLDISGTFKVAGLSEFRLGATFNSSQVNNSDFVVMTDTFPNTLFVASSSDRVGIGISTPQKLLDVNGAGQAVTFVVNPGGVSGVGTFQVNGISSVVPLNVNAATNRVGIKTTTPAVELDVVGATNISGDLSVDTNVLKVDTSNNFVGINKTPTVALDVSGASVLNSTLFVTGATTLSSTLGVNGATSLSSTLGVSGAVVMSSTLAVLNNLNIDSGVLFVDTSSNKVGVNTTSPTSSLTVSGSANITNDLDAGGIFYVKNTGVGINNSSPAFDLDVIGDVAISGILTVDTSTLVVDSANNKIGIRTVAPAVELDVTGATNISGDLSVDTNVLKVDTSNNFVGINKTPTLQLDVSGAVQATSYQIEPSAGKLTKIYFQTGSANTLSGLAPGVSNTFFDTVTGSLVGDFVLSSLNTVPGTTDFTTDVTFMTKVTANDTVAVTFTNTDASGQTHNFTDSVTLRHIVARAAAS